MSVAGQTGTAQHRSSLQQLHLASLLCPAGVHCTSLPRMSLRRLMPLLALLAVCIPDITAQDEREEAPVEYQLISDYWITDYLGCCRYYPHNMWAYWKCCMNNNSCRSPCPLWSAGKKGCRYNGMWYPIGAVMEQNAKKCLEIRCCLHQHGSWPPTHMLPGPHMYDVFDTCDCCEYEGQLYQAGQTIAVGCDVLVCENGEWRPNDGRVAGSLPCPPGSIPDGEYCLWVEPIWLTWPEAAEICECKGGELIQLPDSEDERMQLVDKLNPCGGLWATNILSKDGLCAAVTPGSMGKELFQISCDMRLRPVCKVPLQPCEEGICIVNGIKYQNGTTIDTCPIHECISIVCVNGYPTTVIDESCCEVEGPDGIDLVPSGTPILLDNQQCVCQEGIVNCDSR